MPAQERLELALSRDERKWAQVLAVDLHQVESPDTEDLLAVIARVEGSKVRRAVFLTGDDLPIDDRALARQGQHRVADAGKAVRKVSAFFDKLTTSSPLLRSWQR
jgi:hypothetical protein